MPGNLHLALPDFTRNNLQDLSGLLVFDMPQVRRQLLVKDAMQPDKKTALSRIGFRMHLKIRFNLPLALDMGKAFQLEVSPGGIG